MKTLKKGQNIDFIIATHEDDAGALSRVSAISSSFSLARITATTMIEKGRPLDCALIDNPLFLPAPASWRW